jgi:hypothetical protein
MINIAIPDDSNCNTKETEKLSKHKDLETEVGEDINHATYNCSIRNN